MSAHETIHDRELRPIVMREVMSQDDLMSLPPAWPARIQPSTATDPRKLAADLRERINPAYVNTIGTESYERHLCAEAIDGLLAQRDEMLAALNAIVFQVVQGKVLERDACITQARAAIAKVKL